MKAPEGIGDAYLKSVYEDNNHMNHQEFSSYQASVLEKVIRMKDTKGKEYANDDGNRFGNFDRLAATLGMTNIQIGWVYLAKHLDSISSYCRTGQSFSEEGIEGRIVDAITYLTLIAGMIKEMDTKPQPPVRNADEEKYVWKEKPLWPKL